MHNYRSVSGLSNAVSPPPNVALGDSGTVAAGMLSPSKTDKVGALGWQRRIMPALHNLTI